MAPFAGLLADGRRLHLNHGPIDLIIGADGAASDVKSAYRQAVARFETILQELVAELPLLRSEVGRHGVGSQGSRLKGKVARRMERAVLPHWQSRVTPMAAVAGSVAEEILEALCEGTDLSRAYVNNGGDIACHLVTGTGFAVASPAGRVRIAGHNEARGIATSGWGGRSFSLGIADAVTVLAGKAAQADVAATLIANAVDLPGSNKIRRQRACEIQPDSDLRDRLVTVDVAKLDRADIESALASGIARARQLMADGFILGATLLVQGITCAVVAPDDNVLLEKPVQRGFSAAIQ
jgi:uncharacterized protein